MDTTEALIITGTTEGPATIVTTETFATLQLKCFTLTTSPSMGSVGEYDMIMIYIFFIPECLLLKILATNGNNLSVYVLLDRRNQKLFNNMSFLLRLDYKYLLSYIYFNLI